MPKLKQPTKPKKVAPYLSGSTLDFLSNTFKNWNHGSTHILSAYPALYRETLKEVAGIFTENELKLIIDVFNSHSLTPNMSGQELWFSVSEGCKYESLDTKWSVKKEDIQAKIETLTCFQRSVVEVWANGFWYADTDKYIDIESRIRMLME